MNYAEDRLDRRAAAGTPLSSSSLSPVGGEAENPSSSEKAGGSLIERDLARARDVFVSHSANIRRRRRRRRRRPSSLSSSSLSSSSSSYEDETDDESKYGDASIARSLRELRDAHELMGRALRDSGRNAHAVYHFGMAWRVSRHGLLLAGEEDEGEGEGEDEESKWRSVGDYAQMCELAGFPELGMLALLFHRAGGCPHDHCDDDYRCCDDDDADDADATMRRRHASGCGCGVAGCGESPCYVAFPARSPVVEDALEALALMDSSTIATADHGDFPAASDVLARMARIMRRSGDVDFDVDGRGGRGGGGGGRVGGGVPLAEMSTFLVERGAMRDVPSILRFWEDKDRSDDDDADDDDRGGQHWRILPPVVQLLLLKLLYSSPMSGPCLRLACLAVPHLAARFPPSSAEGRALSRTYKSHWAYYVLVRSLVLGERTKEHRRRVVVIGNGREATMARGRHVPVWDAVFGPVGDVEEGAEGVGGGGGVSISEEVEEGGKKKDGGGGGGGGGASQGCGDYLRAILRSVERSKTERDGPTSDDEPPDRTPWVLPRAVLQRMSSSSSHPPIFVVGDSHVLSLAWQTLRIDPSRGRTTTVSDGLRGSDGGRPAFRTAVPFPVTGMKAWHVRPSTRFFTHYNLRACLDRLPRMMRGGSVGSRAAATIILSAGEIDCREGIGGSLLQGYYRDCGDAVRRTVTEYLASLSDLAREYRLQVLVMPVAPHAYRSEKNGKSTGRARRRETTHAWNETLRSDLGVGGVERRTTSHSTNPFGSTYEGVYLLDYERQVQKRDANSPVGYVLHPRYNADYTHVNSAIVPLVEDAILNCGCDLTLL